MMTVNTLDALLHLPELDIEILRDNGTQLIRQATVLDAIYLPALHDTLSSLRSELNDCNEQVGYILTSMPTALKTGQVEELLPLLKDYINQPVETSIEVIDQVIQELKKITADSLGNAARYRTSLDHALTNFGVINVNTADELIPDLEKKLAPLQEQLAKEQATLDDLTEKEKSIDELIDKHEEVDIFDRLKPLIETMQKLKDVDPKDPLADVIKLAMEGISNILGMAKEDVKYSHLIEGRKRLQRHMDDIRASMRERQESAAAESQKLSQLQAFQALDTPRDAYLQEARKLDEALQLFTKHSRIDEGADLVEELTRFISHCEQMTVYLDGLHRRWREAA